MYEISDRSILDIVNDVKETIVLKGKIIELEERKSKRDNSRYYTGIIKTVKSEDDIYDTSFNTYHFVITKRNLEKISETVEEILNKEVILIGETSCRIKKVKREGEEDLLFNNNFSIYVYEVIE